MCDMYRQNCFLLYYVSFVCQPENNFFHKTKPIKKKRKKKKKVIIKILTFKRSISLMQSCLALASIISKIFKDKNIEDKNEATKKKYFIL